MFYIPCESNSTNQLRSLTDVHLIPISTDPWVYIIQYYFRGEISFWGGIFAHSFIASIGSAMQNRALKTWKENNGDFCCLVFVRASLFMITLGSIFRPDHFRPVAQRSVRALYCMEFPIFQKPKYLLHFSSGFIPQISKHYTLDPIRAMNFSSVILVWNSVQSLIGNITMFSRGTSTRLLCRRKLCGKVWREWSHCYGEGEIRPHEDWKVCEKRLWLLGLSDWYPPLYGWPMFWKKGMWLSNSRQHTEEYAALFRAGVICLCIVCMSYRYQELFQ